MAKLSKRNADILTRYGESEKSAVWDCHGTMVSYHKALERIATKAGIHFPIEKMQIIEADAKSKIATMIVVGVMNDQEEWSVGEASPSNNKNSYPWAMAEKRAKDRVILKLCGISGEAYSSEEADDFSPMAELLKHNECAAENIDILHNVKELIANDEHDNAIAAFRDLNEADQKTLWRAHTKGGMLTHNERKILKGI